MGAKLLQNVVELPSASPLSGESGLGAECQLVVATSGAKLDKN